MNNKILIASAKGGVGKSTAAVGLALAFSEMGKSVLLIDCDASSRSLDLLCGSDGAILYNLGDIMLNRIEPEEALTAPFPDYPGISFCAAPYAFQEDSLWGVGSDGVQGSREASVRLNVMIGEAAARLMEAAKRDIVILDTSSGGGVECALGLSGALTTVLITAEQSKTSIRAAEYTAAQMEKIGISNQRLIVSGFDGTAAAKGERAGIIEMIDRSTLKCVGVAPFDRRLVLRQESGLLPDKKCPSKQAYRNIAERLTGLNVPLFRGIRGMGRRGIL